MKEIIQDVIQEGNAYLEWFKHKQLYGPAPTEAEEQVLFRMGDALKALIEGDEGALQDALAAMAALIHFHGQADE